MIPSSPKRYTTPYGSSSSSTSSGYPTNNATSLAREKGFANDANSAEQMKMAHLRQERDRAEREKNKDKLKDRQRRLQADNDEIRHLEVEIQRLDQEFARLSREISDEQKKIEATELIEKKTQNEMSKNSSDLEVKKTFLAEEQKKEVEFQEKFNSAKQEVQKATDLINSINIQINTLKRESDLKHRENLNTETEQKHSIDLAHSLEGQLQSLNRELEIKKRELKVLEDKVLAVQHQIDEAKRKNGDYASKSHGIKTENDKMQESIRNLEAELNKAKQDLIVKNRKVTEALVEMNKHAEEIHTKQTDLNQKKKVTEMEEFEIKKHESEKAFKLRNLEIKKRALSELEAKKHNLAAELAHLRLDSKAVQAEVQNLESAVKKF